MRDRRVVRMVVMGAAGCFALAAAWNVLIQTGVSAPPQPGDNAAYFAWWRPVEWQTASVHLLTALGFAALAVTAVRLPTGPAGSTAEAARVGMGPMALAIGGALGAGASLLQFGGQQAVVDASTTSIDPGVLGTIGYTVDRVTAAIQLGAYATLACAVLSIGLAGPMAAARRSRVVPSIVLGGGLLLLALLQEGGPTDLTDPLEALLAIVVLPVWAWSLFRPTAAESGARATVSAA